MGNTGDLDSVEGFAKGSPPHTWGILLVFRFIPIAGGITPTYMGNTD